jgi:hypothetical protein
MSSKQRPAFNSSVQISPRQRKRSSSQVQPPKLRRQASLPGNYLSPLESIALLNEYLRDKKIRCRPMIEDIIRELKYASPSAAFGSSCSNGYESIAVRLLDERLLAAEKLKRYPAIAETFRPNLSLTTKDRRFRVKHHPGVYCKPAQVTGDADDDVSENDSKASGAWSCCQNTHYNSAGCDCLRIVDPDSRCYLSIL